jgi:arylsulfatase A-like enzyme
VCAPRELERLRGTANAAVLELDLMFADLWQSLEERGLAESTVVILTADHGEHLGEHHLLDHQYSLSQTLIRVPLVIRFAPRFEPGRDARPVMSLDLFPTLLELAGVEVLAVGAGVARSLLAPAPRRVRLADYSKPFARPLESARKARAEHDVARFERGQLALIDSPWKCVQEIGGSARLYDLSNDPGELRDVAVEQLEVLERMQTGLGALLRAAQPVGRPGELKPLSAERLQRLRELGDAGDDGDDGDDGEPDDAEKR